MTQTICPYCGVGCNLELHVQDNEIVKVTSPDDHDITRGNLCIKGRFGFQHVQARTGRLGSWPSWRSTGRRRQLRGPSRRDPGRRRRRRGAARPRATGSPPRSRSRSAPPARARTAISVAVTMRTPGDDLELAAGFLFTEGLVATPAEIATIRYCARRGRPSRPTTSSPSTCGGRSTPRRLAAQLLRDVELRRLRQGLDRPDRESLRAARRRARRRPRRDRGLPDTLRAAQRVFARTGGLHAAGLFARDGALLACARTSAGTTRWTSSSAQRLLAGRLPLARAIVLVSGARSFELVQKAAVAGIPSSARSRRPRRWPSTPPAGSG